MPLNVSAKCYMGPFFDQHFDFAVSGAGFANADCNIGGFMVLLKHQLWKKLYQDNWLEHIGSV